MIMKKITVCLAVAGLFSSACEASTTGDSESTMTGALTSSAGTALYSCAETDSTQRVQLALDRSKLEFKMGSFDVSATTSGPPADPTLFTAEDWQFFVSKELMDHSPSGSMRVVVFGTDETTKFRLTCEKQP
jgi:hypothetical protein